MRRINSEFETKYMSEEGHKLFNRDYFGYVEMDDFACYVMADSLDSDADSISAKLAVESIIRCFVEQPTMDGYRLKHYMNQAHRELMKHQNGMRLKASVVMVVTDYRKTRFCHVGNSRFYLIRNGRYLTQSKDQSLTQNLITTQKLALDQAAVHEERNNLYSYLGEHGVPEIVVSPKIKLEDGDILAQLTRGLWEHCGDEELLRVIDDAKEPQDIINAAEDIILGRQEETGAIDNYSLAITMVRKVYQSPKKKLTFKRILTILIPILILVIGISVVCYLRYRSVKTKETNLIQYMESGEKYLQYDNYKKASEEYTEAKKMARDLKFSEALEEADQYLKLTDQILLADESLLSQNYEKAQELYLAARELSVKAGNVGKKYIELQLEHTKGYMDLYDWIQVGEIKEEYGDLNGAIAAYKTAREKASALYAREIKEEALKKQTAAEQRLAEKQQAAEDAEEAAKKEAQAQRDEQAAEEQAEVEKEKESQAAEKELEEQQKVNDQKNAIDLVNKGNDLMADEQYEYAITFYRTAQTIYYRLELNDMGDMIGEKIMAAQAGSNAQKEAKAAASAVSETQKNEEGPGNTKEME